VVLAGGLALLFVGFHVLGEYSKYSIVLGFNVPLNTPQRSFWGNVFWVAASRLHDLAVLRNDGDEMTRN